MFLHCVGSTIGDCELTATPPYGFSKFPRRKSHCLVPEKQRFVAEGQSVCQVTFREDQQR